MDIIPLVLAKQADLGMAKEDMVDGTDRPEEEDFRMGMDHQADHLADPQTEMDPHLVKFQMVIFLVADHGDPLFRSREAQASSIRPRTTLTRTIYQNSSSRTFPTLESSTWTSSLISWKRTSGEWR